MIKQRVARDLAIVLGLVLLEIDSIIGHHDASSSAAATDSSSESVIHVERDDSIPHRRSHYKQEWQYEGLPIEFPSRRNMENAILKHDIKSTTMKAGRRRSLVRKEEKYEGLPIDFENRRHLNIVKEKPTTSTPTTEPPTEAPNPPLDRRFRRVYNPDEVATINDFPFMAALMVNGELWCGAVVIARDSVLTAAHCLQLQYNNRFFREYVKMLSVRVGSTNATYGGEVVRVSEIFFHPNYKPQTLEFNVALLKVHKNMTFGRDDPKIDMIEYSRDKTVPVDNKVMFLGWGSVLGSGGTGGQVLLQKVELPVYDLADCQDIYGRNLVSRNNFCAGYITMPKNVCNHDAGGPAIMDGILIGILSFSSTRCDKPDQPAVFSTIGVFAPWLEKLGEKKYQLRNTAIKTT